MMRRLAILIALLMVAFLGISVVQQNILADNLPLFQSGAAISPTSNGNGPEQMPVDAKVAPLAIQSTAAYAALPEGLGPFLAKPFAEAYDAPAKLHSFFDHRLPLYSAESGPGIPSDIRDSQGTITQIFTGESRTAGGQGSSWYSGHNGFDYADRSRDLASLSIRAAADGVIARGRETSSCRVYINHDASLTPDNHADFTSFYTHLSAMGEAPPGQRTRPGRNPNCGIYWCAGDSIAQGQVVGTEGNDPCGGTSTGIHLHFGVVAGSLDAVSSINFVDPFGWWSNEPDPWSDTRLTQRGTSHWLWAAPARPQPNTPGYWGDDIAAQTDDTDASFHRFTAIGRESLWVPLADDPALGVNPVGSGAWQSTSLANNNQNNETWAVWALHVPDTATYRIQVHIPDTPANAAMPTATARYQVFIPYGDSVDVWQAQDVNQNRANEWINLAKESGTDTFELQSRDIVLVRLGDITGQAGSSVLFDAVRLHQVQPGEPPQPGDLRRVGFAIDNSTSMLEQGKINVVRSVVPPWIDVLETSPDSYTYALDAFADNVPSVNVTEDPEIMKGWIAGLQANDNNLPNYDCEEASLGAIRALAPHVTGGDILLFTDDLPKNPLTEGATTAVVLAREHAKLHAIILPKTCSGGTVTGWLAYRALALTTGGTYQTVSTSNTDEALQIVLAEMESNVELSNVSDSRATYRDGALTVTNGESTHTVVVDPTVSEVSFLLNVLEGSFSLALYRPDGSYVSALDPGVTYIDSGSAKYYRIENPLVGAWQADVVGSGEYVLRSSGNSPIQFAYLGDTYVAQGQMMQLAARITGPVDNPAFTLETPEGQFITTVPMVDNGTLGDYSAGDGVYTGLYTPIEDTDLRMRVTGTTAGGQQLVRLDSSLIRLTSVSVTEPGSASLPAGEEHTFEFGVANMSSIGDYYRLTASSSNSWIVSGPPSQIYLAPGETEIVSIRVAVPEGAMPNTIDNVRLTATHSDNAADLGTAATNVFVPDIDESGGEPVGNKLYLPVIINNFGSLTQQLINGNFEQGADVGWSEWSSNGYNIVTNDFLTTGVTAHGGTWAAWLGGAHNETSVISQQTTIPMGQSALVYYHWIGSADYCGYDLAAIFINGVKVHQHDLCNDTNTNGWTRQVINLGAYAGQEVMLEFVVETDGSLNSNLFIDDVGFSSSVSAAETQEPTMDAVDAATSKAAR